MSTRAVIIHPQERFERAKGGFSPDTQKKLDSGSLRIVDGRIGIKREITGEAGKVDYIDSTTVKKVGTSDWNENKLLANNNLWVEKIKISYATHASTTDPALLKYTSDQASVDTAFLYGKYYIKQRDKVLFDMPISAFFSEAKSEASNGDEENAFMVDHPFMIYENEPVEMYVEYAKGQTVSTGSKHHTNVELIGQLTRL